MGKVEISAGVKVRSADHFTSSGSRVDAIHHGTLSSNASQPILASTMRYLRPARGAGVLQKVDALWSSINAPVIEAPSLLAFAHDPDGEFCARPCALDANSGDLKGPDGKKTLSPKELLQVYAAAPGGPISLKLNLNATNTADGSNG